MCRRIERYARRDQACARRPLPSPPSVRKPNQGRHFRDKRPSRFDACGSPTPHSSTAATNSRSRGYLPATIMAPSKRPAIYPGAKASCHGLRHTKARRPPLRSNVIIPVLIRAVARSDTFSTLSPACAHRLLPQTAVPAHLFVDQNSWCTFKSCQFATRLQNTNVR